jgi:phospholipase C
MARFCESYSELIRCRGSNGWSANQGALANGTNDQWAIANTPWSWGHFTRKEIPNHFAIAEGWAVGDMYAESVIASTNPNRVVWMSGTINAPGSPPGLGQGGMYVKSESRIRKRCADQL